MTRPSLVLTSVHQVRLGCGCSYKFKDGIDDMNSTIEFDCNVVTGNPSKEVMATDAAPGFGGIQVGSITMDI